MNGRDRRRLITAVMGGSKISYLLRDLFTTDLAAGAIDGIACEPGLGTRKVIDTENKLSISGGLARFSGGKASPERGDPALWINNAVTREAGRMMIVKTPKIYSASPSGIVCEFGFLDTNDKFAGYTNGDYFFSYQNAMNFVDNKVAQLNLFTPSDTDYRLAIVLRAAGSFVLCKGGVFSSTEMLLIRNDDTTAALYAALINYNSAFQFDFISIPEKKWLPIPVLSDSFHRAGALANSDGLGHPEANGGSGLAWTDNVGTWATYWTGAKYVAQCGTLVGGIGIATVDTGKADIAAQIEFTRSAGSGGLVLRYVDADNYLYAVHDGTNGKLVERVAGSETTLLTTASAYSLNGKINVYLRGSTALMIYANADIGTTAVVSLLTGTKHGLYTSNAANELKNILIYPKGTGGEHSALDAFFLDGPTGNIWPVGDSKTAATADGGLGYPPVLTDLLRGKTNKYWYENPLRASTDGGTTLYLHQQIDAGSLDSIPSTPQPEYILCNMGVNDIGTNDTSQADFETNYGACLDYFHSRWPESKIYLMRIGNGAFSAPQTVKQNLMDDTWIPNIISSRSSFCFLGPDERVFLEGGDDYASLTTDGCHPNHAGYAVTAAAWLATLGY